MKDTIPKLASLYEVNKSLWKALIATRGSFSAEDLEGMLQEIEDAHIEHGIFLNTMRNQLLKLKNTGAKNDVD